MKCMQTTLQSTDTQTDHWAEFCPISPPWRLCWRCLKTASQHCLLLPISLYMSLNHLCSLNVWKAYSGELFCSTFVKLCFLKFQGCLFKGAVVRGRVIYVFIYVLIYLCLFGDKRQWSFLKVYICYWINYVYDKIKLSRKSKNSVNH